MRTKVCYLVRFRGKLLAFDLLIELYPLVPFVPVVLNAQSAYSATTSAWTPATYTTVAEAGASSLVWGTWFRVWARAQT